MPAKIDAADRYSGLRLLAGCEHPPERRGWQLRRRDYAWKHPAPLPCQAPGRRSSGSLVEPSFKNFRFTYAQFAHLIRNIGWKRFTWLDFGGPGLWRLPGDLFHIFLSVRLQSPFFAAVSGEWYVNRRVSIPAAIGCSRQRDRNLRASAPLQEQKELPWPIESTYRLRCARLFLCPSPCYARHS